MLNELSIVFSVCISIVSLIISILSYRLKTPKVKIQIIDKRYDSFFGNVQCEHNEHVHKNRISGARLRLINNSPNEITIMGIALKCKKETFRLIDPSNDYWEIVEFLFNDENGEETSDGSAIYYSNDGIILPLILKAYDGKDVIALFYHFPIKIRKKTWAKIIVQTTIGVKTKKVHLIEYDKQYANKDYRDYLQYKVLKMNEILYNPT